MGCGAKCSKMFLFVVNVLVWLVGAVFLAIGIWVAVSPSTFVQQAMTVVSVSTNDNQQSTALANYFLSNNSLMMIGAYIMIGVGGLLFLVGFCGCCGACKESKCLLVIYIIFCVLAFLITLAAGIVEAVYLNQIGSLMTQGFTQIQVTVFDATYNSSIPLSQMWFSVMQSKQCCGVNGTSDFTVNAATMATYWSNNNQLTCAGSGQCFTGAAVPVSCCALNSNNYTVANPNCPTSGTGAYSTSCQTAFIGPFSSQLQTYATIIMGITFGLAAFCLLAIIAASTMIHAQNSGKGGDRYA